VIGYIQYRERGRGRDLRLRLRLRPPTSDLRPSLNSAAPPCPMPHAPMPHVAQPVVPRRRAEQEGLHGTWSLTSQIPSWISISSYQHVGGRDRSQLPKVPINPLLFLWLSKRRIDALALYYETSPYSFTNVRLRFFWPISISF
jgi:hypothetical protein